MSDISMSDFSGRNAQSSSSDRKLKAVCIIFGVLSVLLLLEAVVYKLALPSLGRPKIAFSGERNITKEELASLLQPMSDDNWFSFDTEEAASIISSYPAVDSVNIVKHFPDKISITVKERVPVAMTFLSDNGRTYPVEIDNNGVLFSRDNSAVSDGSIPIISGLPVEHLSEGMRIPQKYRALIEQIGQIQTLPQKYFAAVSEICVVPKEYGNYELMLIPVRSKTRVLTDRALNEDALQYMMVVLDVVSSIEPNVAEIDLRYGSVSYRTR